MIIDGTDVYGSVFAGTVSANTSMARDTNSSVTLHYDSAVIRAGASCPAETGTCQTCAQCNGSAECLANACFTCSNDNDCCAPFRVHVGQMPAPYLLIEVAPTSLWAPDEGRPKRDQRRQKPLMHRLGPNPSPAMVRAPAG